MVLVNSLEVKILKPKKKYKLILSVSIVLLFIINVIGLYFGNMYSILSLQIILLL